MLVNGKKIDAIFLGVQFDYAEVTDYKDWLRESNLPKIYEQQVTYSEATITLIVEGANLEQKKSNIVSNFRKCSVTFDSTSLEFIGSLKSVKEKRINVYAAEVEITLEGYKAGAETTKYLSGSTTYSFVPEGNLETDCIIKITPTANLVSLLVKINGTEFTLSSLNNGTTYIVDGINGKVYTADGTSCISRFTGFFPALKGAELNTVNSSSSFAGLQITYRGRYI